MKKFLLLLIVISCQPQAVNQYIKVPGKQIRNGLWIEKSDSEFGEVISKGRYDHGEKVGTWRTTAGGKRFQTDKIKNGITRTKFYHQNGKLMEKGQSRVDISKDQRIWYYFGDWKYYDKEGKLRMIKHYSDQAMKVDTLFYKK